MDHKRLTLFTPQAGPDGPIVRSLVDAKTAKRSGESGEMIEPEEGP